MMPESRARHAERIDRVLAHIECADEESDLTLERLCAVAAMSPYHFHRIFRLMTGETLAETVRRVRLARSLPDLADKTIPITVAAGTSGYATSQTYGRALRATTGGTASDIRAGKPGLIDALLSPAALDPAGLSASPLSIEIVSTAPLRLLAIRNIGAYSELNTVYERLFDSVFSQHPMDALVGIYGIWHEDPRFADPAGLHFDCAISVGDLPAVDGVEVIAIPAGRHARLRHVGDYDSLHVSIDRLYAAAIEQGAGELADRPLRVHYIDDPETCPPAQWRSDIYLPLTPG
ncbi:AraC family transcriptional regulator [Maricaulis maris]|uniref:AraC family transcriptional regulator n=1 Tax=Maricaulis maris TaxID=74318 RepID=UPI002924695F|nr:AraC family transcriptional regulator [Maricaulis maris]